MNNTMKIGGWLLAAVLVTVPSSLFAHTPRENESVVAFGATQCASATENNLGGWSVQNVCSEAIDVGLAYRVHGSNGAWTFRVYRRLNPGFQVETPNCFQCGYDYFLKAAPSSEHVPNYELRPETD
jgi:hypothetical protein